MTPPLPHRRLALLMVAVLLVAGVAGPARAGGGDPKAVLDDIFGQMNTMCGGNGDGPAYDLEAIAKKYFVPALVKIVTRDYEQPGALGFDILVDGQDCKTSDLKLDIIGGGGSTSIGRATFKNMGEERVIDLHMTNAGGDWMVADVVYRHRPFSLKAQ
jgi:hypothetical protein